MSVILTLSPQSIMKLEKSIYEEIFFNIGHQTKQSCNSWEKEDTQDKPYIVTLWLWALTKLWQTDIKPK